MSRTLRGFRNEDRDPIVELDELVLAELDVLGLPRQFADLKEIDKQYLAHGAFVVAEADAVLVGMGGIRFSSDKTARINRMRVHPEQQGTGIGRSILIWLEEKAVAAGIEKILLNTLATQKAAQKLYESSGYVKVGEGSPDGFDILKYEKKVGHEPD